MDGLSFIPEGSTFTNFNDAKYALWRATVDSHKSYSYSKGSQNEGFFVYTCPAAKSHGCTFRMRMACKSAKNGGNGESVTITISKPHDPDEEKCPRHIHTKWTGAGNSAFIARRNQAIFEYDVGVKSSAILAAEKGLGNEINADQARRAVRKGKMLANAGTPPVTANTGDDEAVNKKRKAQQDEAMRTLLKKAKGEHPVVKVEHQRGESQAGYAHGQNHGHSHGHTHSQHAQASAPSLGSMHMEDEDANGEEITPNMIERLGSYVFG